MHSTPRLPRLALAPLLGLATLAAFGPAARPADAQATTYFPNDTTINYAVPGDAFVGYNTSLIPSSPTVNLVTGGTVSDILWGMGTSTVNVSGGLVDSYLYATQGSAFNVSGGTFAKFQGVSFADVTTGQFNFVGSGLSYAPDPGGLLPFGGADYTLTGLLQNGQSVTGDVIEVAPGATMFTLANAAPIPEASTAAPLGLGMLCLAGLMLAARPEAGAVTRRRNC